jgi:tRNA(Ile2) C34 agmatinyltransferase TiaS
MSIVMMIYIGLDDTDNLESRGTGRLAREIAAALAVEYPVLGVTRHQLLVDPRVPYTSHNSSAAILIEAADRPPLDVIFERTRSLMELDFIPGSDPGLCVADEKTARLLTAFGQRAKQELVDQAEARLLAQTHGALLAGLGGTQDGVIGAVSAVGLAAGGQDGRYLLIGRSRDLTGLQPLEAVHALGMREVRTLAGQVVEEGWVLADKLRPARRQGRPVLFVEWGGEHWLPLKEG